MIIYVEHISERLIYTFDFIFKAQNIPYQLTNDLNQFLNYSGPKFNYSNYPSEDFITLTPAELLFDESISPQNIEKGFFNEIPCLAFDRKSDPFASIFYVLSRYEEYLDYTPDEHNRFRAQQSVVYKFGWQKQLVCERWTKAIIDFLFKKGILDKNYQKEKLTLSPTFDIDNSFAYLHKNGWRRIVSTGKDYLQKNTDRLNERKKVLAHEIRDPYDTFDYIEEIASRGFSVRLFWLLGDYGQYDKNLSYLNPAHRALIQRMTKTCVVGIHPSYASNEKEYLLKEEQKRLSDIIGKEVKTSRQHFLKLKFPDTFLNNLRVGITDDYTLGFAAKIGFRSGTLRAHQWFNLTKNECTSLRLHPFAYMDGTLREYEKLSIASAKVEIKELYNEALQFGGDFVFLWHNETINDYKKWKGWTEVLEFTLSLNENNYE